MTRSRFATVIHNLVAHPLLVLWPSVGEWLHELTANYMDEDEQVPAPVQSGEVGGWAVPDKTSNRVDVDEDTWPPFEVSRVQTVSAKAPRLSFGCATVVAWHRRKFYPQGKH